ncbi:MAG TPA: hypothetical protein VIU12_10625 [Chryseolinea sp.]
MSTSARLLLTGIFLLTGVLFPATTWAKPKKVPGQIIDNEGYVIDVFFKMSSTPNFSTLQTRVVYYDSGNQKHETNADKAQEIRFTIGTKQYRMVSMPNEWNQRSSGTFAKMPVNIFVYLQIDGPLRMYHVFESRYIAGGMGPNGLMTMGTSYERDQYYLQRDGEMFHVRGISFRKDMMAYLADCPEVTKRIEAREWIKENIIQIVRTYNLKCTYSGN